MGIKGYFRPSITLRFCADCDPGRFNIVDDWPGSTSVDSTSRNCPDPCWTSHPRFIWPVWSSQDECLRGFSRGRA